ncbi:MAG: exo-alpha-sialidase, partial [Candidatus Aminicenantes bacterium]|nr:exo-alpha-sialidase [Candidatus Aminicenantes bacterium]
IKVSESQHIIQRPVIVPDPSNVNNIYIVFRRFKHLTAPDGIVFVRSTDGGQTFSKPVDVAVIEPFDQATTSTSFRTNSYPTMTVDAQGRLYAAWAQRVGGPAGYARIFMKTSTDKGMTWTGPSTEVVGDANARGHQFKPVLSFSAGKITLGWWDQRNDQTKLFTPWIDDANIPLTDPGYRHTIDVRVAQADPGADPVFGTSKRVSRYLYVFDTDASGNPITKDVGGTLYYAVKQAQWNPPNLPMFQDGNVPFHGDWVDLAPSPAFLPDGNGGWRFNTGMDGVDAAALNGPRPQFPNVHFTWTDNRDVRWPLKNGKPDLWGDWTQYTPLGDGDQNGLYTHLQSPPCSAGQTGMRNQNVYTSTLSKGLIVGSLGNTKPLNTLGYVNNDPHGTKIPRAFAVSVKNETNASRTFVLTFEKNEEWVDASFAQFEPLETLALRIDAHSTVSVPVYLKLIEDAAQDGTLYETVKVHVEETQALDPSNPLYGVIILNLDHRNPPIQDTPLSLKHIIDEEVYNPFIDIDQFKVETYDVSGDWSVSPAFENPEDMNSDTINPNIRSDGSANPNIRSGAANPNIRSPNIRSPNIRSMSVTDASWETENQGNTTATYFFNMNTDYEKPDPNIVPADQAVEFQLLIYKVYYTPAADGCLVGTEEHQELVANIANPNIRSPNIRSPNIRSSNLASSALSAMRVQEEILDGATVALAPGEKARFILRATDPDLDNTDVFDPGTPASPKIYAAVSSFAANTEDAKEGNLTPPVATTFPAGQDFLTITTSSLNDGFVGQGYFETLQAFGTPPFTWSINNSDLPPGLTQANGVISGTPQIGDVTYPHTYQF